MPRLKKKLIVVGDRLLVRTEEGEERTNSGLILPQSALAARQAKGGWVVNVGPGIPVAAPMDLDDDPWSGSPAQPHFLPMQAQEGDYVLFLHKAAVEITFEKKNYLIVPYSAVLVLMREGFEGDVSEWDGNSN